MLVRILNTLRSRIWDVFFFSFFWLSKSTVGENGDFPEGYGLKSKGLTHSSGVFHLNRNCILLGNPLIFPTQNADFIWRQRTEKQKLDIEENVMSEQVKMPVRHFLRRDYLHIFFYIKFLLFVSLVH